MKLFKPETIFVGFQKRNDTHNGKLGFMSYSMNGKKLVNQSAVERWSDSSIKKREIDNKKTFGFVLSKAGIHQLKSKNLGFLE